MSRAEPSLERIEEAVTDLLRTEEIATPAVLDGQGAPSASAMDIAADGLRVYTHTFTRTRRRSEMVADERVGHVVNHLPPGGYDERFKTRSLQVKGRATLVVDPAEIASLCPVQVVALPQGATDPGAATQWLRPGCGWVGSTRTGRSGGDSLKQLTLIYEQLVNSRIRPPLSGAGLVRCRPGGWRGCGGADFDGPAGCGLRAVGCGSGDAGAVLGCGVQVGDGMDGGAGRLDIEEVTDAVPVARGTTGRYGSPQMAVLNRESDQAAGAAGDVPGQASVERASRPNPSARMTWRDA
ncbi:pyridoxamine 5'-phosphate oxidase family protein [Streptomyces sp. NPDC017991]|uniref:pyridoxamine 5'-phosphate oxidase family protein n=1 Tax=Streptomyces sp. NPDC017991 TaxID=3365026 RepID=UPI0037A880B2